MPTILMLVCAFIPSGYADAQVVPAPAQAEARRARMNFALEKMRAMADGKTETLDLVYDGTSPRNGVVLVQACYPQPCLQMPTLPPSYGGGAGAARPIARAPDPVARPMDPVARPVDPVARAVPARPALPAVNQGTTPCEDLRQKARRLRTAASQCDTDVSNGAPYCNVDVTFDLPSIPRSLSADGARGYARQFEDVANSGGEHACADFGGQGVIPMSVYPTRLQQPESGVGPLYRRTWSTTITNGKNARDLMSEIKRNINLFSRGGLVADTPFKFVDGPNPYEIAVGNTYGIDGPMKFNPFVKATAVDSISFEFTTLQGHPEAARVRFMAYDSDAGTVFIIRVYGRPSTEANRALYTAGYWVQTQIWDNFTENVRKYCGGESTPVERSSIQE